MLSKVIESEHGEQLGNTETDRFDLNAIHYTNRTAILGADKLIISNAIAIVHTFTCTFIRPNTGGSVTVFRSAIMSWSAADYECIL